MALYGLRLWPALFLFFQEEVPEERQILTTGFNPVIRREPTKLHLFGKRVP
jgi:hypothetical protein